MQGVHGKCKLPDSPPVALQFFQGSPVEVHFSLSGVAIVGENRAGRPAPSDCLRNGMLRQLQQKGTLRAIGSQLRHDLESYAAVF